MCGFWIDEPGREERGLVLVWDLLGGRGVVPICARLSRVPFVGGYTKKMLGLLYMGPCEEDLPLVQWLELIHDDIKPS